MELKNDEKEITESGVDILNFTGDKPKTKTRRYRTKHKMFREFTLATLSALVKTRNIDHGDSAPQLCALDAFAGTGIAGLQWKKHLGKGIHVTLAEQNDISLLQHNAETNSLCYSKFNLKPERIPGEHFSHQEEKEVHVCQVDAKAVLAMEAFNFVYLSPHKNCAAYFDSALQNLKGGGLLCLIMSDVSVFVRSPHVVKRSYNADVIKTEYFKEMAGRIILACLARAAARFSKGISSQYVLCHEDNLLLCVKITRGHAAADKSLHQIASLLHCRFCEQRIFMPNQLAPIEDPYSLLACTCKQSNPGKTAIILGPMWNGPLNDTQFLEVMFKESRQLRLSSKCREVIQLLVTETQCSDIEKSSQPDISDEQQTMLVTSKDQEGSSQNANNEINVLDNSNEATDLSLVTRNDPKNKNQNQEQIVKSEGENTTVPTLPQNRLIDSLKADKEIDETVADENNEIDPREISLLKKRKAGHSSNCENDLLSASKRCRAGDQKYSPTASPTSVHFYYGINKFKRTHVPKLDKLVTILHSHGHRASRTHFDPCAVRTSATVGQFLSVLG